MAIVTAMAWRGGRGGEDWDAVVGVMAGGSGLCRLWGGVALFCVTELAGVVSARSWIVNMYCGGMAVEAAEAVERTLFEVVSDVAAGLDDCY